MYYLLAAGFCAVFQRCWLGSMLDPPDLVRCRSGLRHSFWIFFCISCRDPRCPVAAVFAVDRDRRCCVAAVSAVAGDPCGPVAAVFAVEPEGKQLGPCLRAGRRLWPEPPADQLLPTLADGCQLQQVGQLPFPLLCRLVERQVLTVTDPQIAAATRTFWQRTKVEQEYVYLPQILSDVYYTL